MSKKASKFYEIEDTEKLLNNSSMFINALYSNRQKLLARFDDEKCPSHDSHEHAIPDSKGKTPYESPVCEPKLWDLTHA